MPLRFALALSISVASCSTAFAKTDPNSEFALATQELQSGKPQLALKRLDALRKLAKQAQQIGAVESLRSVALLFANRDADATVAVTAAEAALGSPDPLVYFFSISAQTDRFEPTAAVLDRLISAYPDVARTLEAEQLYGFLRRLRTADDRRADEYFMRLAGIGWGGERTGYRDGMALSATRIALKRGRFEDAEAFSTRIIARNWLVRLLTERSFEDLWPKLEARVGDHMEQPLAEAVIVAERRMAERTESIEARQDLVAAYRNAGRLKDAERVAAEFARTADSFTSMTEEGGWLIDSHATLLLRLGKPAESDARYASLRQIAIADAPWLINMIINRAEYLTRTKRDTAAWPLIEEAETLSKTYGSPYARQLVRRMKACVAFRTRRSEAPALVKAVLDNAGDAEAATVEGLMCLDQQDEAARRAIVLLADDRKRSSIVESLLPDDLADGDPSGWGATELLQRPDVKVAFDKVARLLPARFAPPPQVEVVR